MTKEWRILIITTALVTLLNAAVNIYQAGTDKMLVEATTVLAKTAVDQEKMNARVLDTLNKLLRRQNDRETGDTLP